MASISDYERWKSTQMKSGVGAANLVLGSIDANPDEVAGDLNLASEFGKTTGNPIPPRAMVTEYRNVFQAAIERERNSTVLTRAPVLADWLRSPDNAAVAKDDLEGLSWWETASGAGWNAGARGVQRLPQSYNQWMAMGAAQRSGDINQDFGGLLNDQMSIRGQDGNVIGKKLIPDPGDLFSAGSRFMTSRLSDMFGGDQAAAATYYQQQVGQIGQNIAAIPMSPAGERYKTAFTSMPSTGDVGADFTNFVTTIAADPTGFLAFLTETAVESAPTLAAATTATLVTRNPTVGATVMGGLSATVEMGTSPLEFFNEKGIDVSTPDGALAAISDPDLMREAAERGVTRGLIIGVMDGLSGGVAGQQLAKSPFGEAALQAVVQAAFGAGGEAAAQIASGQQFSISDVLIEGLAEVVTAPLEFGGVGGRVFFDNQARARAAEARVALFQELSGQAVNSKLRERMPDAFRDYVAQATANGPVENVYVPASEFATYFQGLGVDPYVLVDTLDGVTRDDLDAALAGGGDLQIPTATYAARIAGSEHDAFLMENMRFDPDQFTSAEAKAFNAKAQDALQEAYDVAEQVRLEEDSLRSFEQEIYDTMVGRLRAAGRSTDVATTEAMLYPAFYRVMAERSGMTTEDFMRQYPLPQVEGSIPEGLQSRNVDALTRTLAEARAQKATGNDGRKTLSEFISDYGGITDPGGELANLGVSTIKRGAGKKTLKLERKSITDGMRSMFGGETVKRGFDDVAQAAIEAGYLADNPVVLEYQAAVADGREVPDIGKVLIDAIADEARGLPQYSAQDAVDPAIAQNESLDQVEQYLAGLGLSLDDDDASIRDALNADMGRQYAQDGEGNMIVQHNLSAANLMHASKIGGIAVPSVAISNVDYPLDGFGEITLLGDVGLIDPRKDAASKVFNADVYSPRYPTVRYKIAKAVFNKVWTRLEKASADLGHVLSGELDNSEVERKGLEAFRDSSAIQLQFLRDTGRDVALPQNTPRTSWLVKAPELAELVGQYATPNEVNGNPEAAEAFRKAIAIEVATVLDARGDGFTAEEVNGWYYDKDGDVSSSVIRDLQREIEIRKRPGVDRTAARQLLRDQVKAYATEFATWVSDQFGSVIASETIETETASGNWKYLPHTLDNVVKVLRRKLRDGEGFNYGLGSLRSNVALQFKSVAAIKAARGSLISADAMKALKDEADNEFMALATSFESFSKNKVSYGFLDNFSEHLKEVSERGVRSLDQYYDGLTDEKKQEVADFLDKLASMPTEYFEAKIQRAVDLSEFKAAVIPKSADASVKALLAEAGVATFEYDPAVNGSRAAMIRSAGMGGKLLFQKDGSGPRGSITLPGNGFANGDTVIRLFETANLSTMLHESGHYFLSVMQDLAAKGEGASVQDYAAIQAWWTANADDVAKDALRADPNSGVTGDDVRKAMAEGTTGDAAKDSAIDIGMQEQWARAFEAYLMDGKAPSIELRSAFEKFRAWLVSVYNKLAGLNVKMTPEISAVFDRMLASDAEIANAQGEVGSGAVFTTAEAMGLTDQEFARFLKLRDQAEDESKAKLLAEVMKPIKREKEKWFKAEREKVRAEVETQINAQPVYRAIEWMGNRRWLGEDQPEDMADIRLSKAILVDRYGPGVLTTINANRGKYTLYTVEGGLDPDDAAGWFGFGSGDELVQAIEKAPSRKAAIDAETDRLMREFHGDALNDGSLQSEALDAVHTDKRGQWIAAELNAVVEVSGRGTGLTAKEALASARGSIAKMVVRDAMNSNRFLAAERKAAAEAERLGAMLAREKIWLDAAKRKIASTARKAVKGEVSPEAVAGAVDAFNAKFDTTETTYTVQDQTRTSAKGNTFTIPGGERTATSTGYNDLVDKLVQAKRRQLLNHALYMESRKVADEVTKAERFVAKLGKKTTRERIAGAGRRDNAQIDYLAAIDEVLTRYDFRKVSGAAEQRSGALAAFVEAMKAAGRENELAIPDAVLAAATRKPYKTLPVEELRGVVDGLKNLEHIASRWNKLIDAQNERDLAETVDEVEAAYLANIKARPVGRFPSERAGVKDRIASFTRKALNTVLTATTLLREIDGLESLGAAYRNIKSPIDAAADRLSMRRVKAANDLEALYGVYSDAERRKMNTREFMPSLNRSLTKWEKIAIALNTGNEGNRLRLIDKRTPGAFTEAQVTAVLKSLDARDAAFVQSVWDYIATFRDEVGELQRRSTGVVPEWVEATPVIIGGVEVKGGYYPLKYDGELSQRVTDDQMKELAQGSMSGRFASAQTKHGHRKARAEASGRPIEIDISVLHRHVGQVIYDLEMSEPTTNAWRIIQDPRIRAAFQNAGRKIDYETLELWVKDVAGGETGPQSEPARVARRLRSNFTAAKLAFNMGTVLLQVTGGAQSMVTVGKRNFVKAMGQYTMDMAGYAKLIPAKSEFMAERQKTFNKDIFDMVNDPKSGPTMSRMLELRNKVIAPAGMFLMVKVQYYTVDLPTWLAGYNQGMDLFANDEAKAIEHADGIVKRAQASGLFADRSAIERGTLDNQTRQNEFVRLFTTLGSYMFAKFNVAYERTGKAGKVINAEGVSIKSAQEALSWVVDMGFLFTLEAVIMAAIKGQLPGDDDDEDEDGWLEFLAKETSYSILSTMPFVRDGVSALKGFGGGGTYGAIIEEFTKPLSQAGEGEIDKAFVKSVINTTGLVTGLPSTPINRIVDAGWKQVEGDDVNPAEYLLGRIGK